MTVKLHRRDICNQLQFVCGCPSSTATWRALKCHELLKTVRIPRRTPLHCDDDAHQLRADASTTCNPCQFISNCVADASKIVAEGLLRPLVCIHVPLTHLPPPVLLSALPTPLPSTCCVFRPPDQSSHSSWVWRQRLSARTSLMPTTHVQKDAHSAWPGAAGQCTMHRSDASQSSAHRAAKALALMAYRFLKTIQPISHSCARCPTNTPTPQIYAPTYTPPPVHAA